MSDSNSFVLKSLAILTILAVGVLMGLYLPSAASSAADEAVGLSADAEDSPFQPRGGSLALDAGRRFIYLPLNNPAVVPASMASFMEDDDIVAGVVVNEQPRAYPQWVLVAYHVVNDTIRETPLMLAHCEICSGTSAFDPIVDGLDGKSLSFQIHGIANGTFSVYDYQTHTVWSPYHRQILYWQDASFAYEPDSSHRGILEKLAQAVSGNRGPHGQPDLHQPAGAWSWRP